MLHLLIIIVIAGAWQPPALAQPGVEMPPGEQLVDFAWADSENLTVLAISQGSFVLRRLELTSESLSVIPVTKSFMAFDAKANNLRTYLSPAGNCIAVLTVTKDPLEPNKIAVYRLEPKGLSEINTRGIPGDFWIEHVVWDSAGRELYLGTKPYIFPEQLFSIGRLGIRTGHFSGMVLKANIDLIDDMVYIPLRDQLAIKCGCHEGSYPLDQMIVLLKPGAPKGTVLHSRAGHLRMRKLGNGMLLLYSEGRQALENGMGTRRDAEVWILPRDKTVLERGELALSGAAATIQTGSDGTWLAFLSPKDPEEATSGNEFMLGLQRVEDGKTLVSSITCSEFKISPSGQMVCAADAERHRLYFFDLESVE